MSAPDLTRSSSLSLALASPVSWLPWMLRRRAAASSLARGRSAGSFDESIEALSALLQRAIPQATTRTLASIYRAARPAARRTNYASVRQTNRTARELARCDSLQRRASCLDTRLHEEANRLLDEAMAPRRALCRAMRERMRGRRPPECAWTRE